MPGTPGGSGTAPDVGSPDVGDVMDELSADDEFSFLSALKGEDEGEEEEEEEEEDEGDIYAAQKPSLKSVSSELKSALSLISQAKGKGKVKARNRGSVVFPASSSKDNKDHFPINNENQARNALARASQYSSAPPWYSGSLQSLVSRVQSAVHSKYPSIKVSKKSKKPGKG
jgi:hypothetical protein